MLDAYSICHFNLNDNNHIFKITVGTRPDSAEFTSDCSKLLVAIEGTLYRYNAGTFVDPEGGVAVLEFGQGGPHAGATVVNTFKDFTQFNAQYVD